MNNKLFTIGHSTHTMEHFMELLKQHSIGVVCDVRSQPNSKYNPQFNKNSLKQELQKNSIKYVFLGEELGARSKNENYYVNGKVQFDRLEKDLLFQEGINRINQGMKNHIIALMCAEKDPIICHRMILVCRKMRCFAKQIKHILADGTIETNAEAEIRLAGMLRIFPDMFRNEKECIEEAYKQQGQKIAYVKKNEAPLAETL